MYDYLDLRQTERLKELVPYKALAPDADEIIKELDRLNNLNKQLVEECQKLDDEETRLNNIINEIQDMCREEYYKKNTTDIDSIGLSNNIWVMIYMKIKENNK